jgi:hypothetical protein
LGLNFLHLLSAILGLALLSPATSAGQDSGNTPNRGALFHIERNKNANIVQYDAQFQQNGTLHSEQPVVAYWVRLAEQGQIRELSWVQKKFAYGFSVKLNKVENTAKLEMVAIPGRTIMIRLDNGDYRAITDINGVKCYVEKLFIHADGEGLSTSVNYIELFGNSVSNDADQYERFQP